MGGFRRPSDTQRFRQLILTCGLVLFTLTLVYNSLGLFQTGIVEVSQGTLPFIDPSQRGNLVKVTQDDQTNTNTSSNPSPSHSSPVVTTNPERSTSDHHTSSSTLSSVHTGQDGWKTEPESTSALSIDAGS